MTVRKMYLYLKPETELALLEYQRLHKDRFKTTSQAADHLLQRALASPVTEGQEDILLPAIRQAVRETVRKETQKMLDSKFDAQTDRIIGVLVKAGKFAAAGLEMGTTVIGRLTGDHQRARQDYKDALHRAGVEFSSAAFRSERSNGHR